MRLFWNLRYSDIDHKLRAAFKELQREQGLDKFESGRLGFNVLFGQKVQCNFCCMWLVRKRNDHCDGTCRTGKLFVYPCFQKRFPCLICLDMHQSKLLLIKHYASSHTEVELKIIGFNKDVVISLDREEK